MTSQPLTDNPPDLRHVDPKTLTFDSNVRAAGNGHGLDPKDLDDAAFLASIREHGVLVPIVAVDGPDGALRIRMGHRRTVAAIATGRPTVPVMVVSDDGDDGGRIVHQVVENDQRRALTDGDRIGAFEQLAALGLTAEQIAAQTGATETRIAAALRVAASKPARTAAAKYDLTIDQAAIIETFIDDKEAVQHLTEAAKSRPDQFDHVAAAMLAKRREAEAKQALVDKLKADGVPLIQQPPHERGATVEDLLSATRKAKAGAARMSAREHKGCVGHVARIGSEWKNTGRVPIIEYWCTDWHANGHKHSWKAKPGTSSSTATAGGGMTEAQKCERRTVIANRKAWTPAAEVRRKWIADLIGRGTPPKGAEAFIARMLISKAEPIGNCFDSYRDGRNSDVRLQILGLPGSKLGAPGMADLLVKQVDAKRATVLALGWILAALEASTHIDTWRQATDPDKAYLEQLQAWGYVLSDVEQLVLSKAKRARTTTPAADTSTDPDPDDSDDLDDDETGDDWMGSTHDRDPGDQLDDHRDVVS